MNQYDREKRIAMAFAIYCGDAQDGFREIWDRFTGTQQYAFVTTESNSMEDKIRSLIIEAKELGINFMFDTGIVTSYTFGSIFNFKVNVDWTDEEFFTELSKVVEQVKNRCWLKIIKE